ncbi:hypothetical protein MNBD_GAMMA09-2731 [hydrothermal vent metagenome]|uniref:Uncharacterized protein n=1 Tax=hydrothermal vent metagenome TaxID=652676 RepID=A0A3B0XGF4_9ZZZZ
MCTEKGKSSTLFECSVLNKTSTVELFSKSALLIKHSNIKINNTLPKNQISLLKYPPDNEKSANNQGIHAFYSSTTKWASFLNRLSIKQIDSTKHLKSIQNKTVFRHKKN